MKLKRQLIFFCFIVYLGITSGCNKNDDNVSKNASILKVGVMKNGDILINGNKSNLKQLKEEFIKLQEKKGEVWYYREAGEGEPPAIIYKVMDILAECKLPITFSSKPDYSDYVGEDGISHPR